MNMRRVIHKSTKTGEVIKTDEIIYGVDLPGRIVRPDSPEYKALDDFAWVLAGLGISECTIEIEAVQEYEHDPYCGYPPNKALDHIAEQIEAKKSQSSS